MTSSERMYALGILYSCIHRLGLFSTCPKTQASIAASLEYDAFLSCGGEQLVSRRGSYEYGKKIYEATFFMENNVTEIKSVQHVREIILGEIWDASVLLPQDPVRQAISVCQQQEAAFLEQLQEPSLEEQKNITCPRCGMREIVIDSEQKRRGDEMPTTKYRCLKCTKRWAKNS